MAKVYIAKESNAWKYSYTLEGKQRVIHIGKHVTRTQALEYERVLERLVDCRKKNREPDTATARAVRNLPRNVRASIRKHGLFDASDCATDNLGDLFNRYEKLKPESCKHDLYVYAKKHFLERFKKRQEVVSVTPENLAKYGEYLLSKRKRPLSPYTVYTEWQCLRGVFEFALEDDIIRMNPFRKVKAGSAKTGKREYQSRDKVLERLDLCNHPEVRLAVALARFGGLRIPCEIREMKWRDITDRVIHVGGKTGERDVPMFLILRTEIVKLSRVDEYVFPTLRKYKITWVYDRFRNALLRNGITLWPKLIHSLRANCITDYAGEGLNQVVLDSIFGNSAEIRRKHYISLLPDDYERVMSIDFDRPDAPPPESFLKRLLPLMPFDEAVALWREIKGGG